MTDTSPDLASILATPGERAVVARIRGQSHGPITRLIDPGETGQMLKPFIFLDYFNAQVQPGFGFGMHPHSGIATLTWQPACDIRYEDTLGQDGILPAGGLEWMNAGGGAWHQGQFETGGMATGFQLWVPMPPSVEDGPGEGRYVPPEEVPVMSIPGGTVRVLLGTLTHEGRRVVSPIHSYQDMNYLVLEMQAECEWTYVPPAGHTVAFAFIFAGDATVLGESSPETLLVLSDRGVIHVESGQTPVRVLIGTARPHEHDLVLGTSSVHTNETSLRKGVERIRDIGRQLRAEGRI